MPRRLRLRESPSGCLAKLRLRLSVRRLRRSTAATILLARRLPPQVLAQSTAGQGGTAVLGGKANGCFKAPLPHGGPGNVIVKAPRGSGSAADQVYKK